MVKRDEFLELSKQFLEQSRRYDRTVNLFREDITKGVEALGEIRTELHNFGKDLSEIRDGIYAFQDAFSKLFASYGVISRDMAESKGYLREIRNLMKKQSKK